MLNTFILTYDTVLHLKWHVLWVPSAAYSQESQQSPGIPCHYAFFTIVRTSSGLQPVGDMDVKMVTPEKHIVTACAWLSFMYSELQKEIEYLGNVILEIQRQEQNPRHLAHNICASYELALHYQR